VVLDTAGQPLAVLHLHGAAAGDDNGAEGDCYAMTQSRASHQAAVDPVALARLDAHLKQRVDAKEIPGCITKVWRHGELVHSNVVGWSDVERRVPASEDTIYRLFSLSKPIASVALMQCHERGLFQLDDPVHEYLPGWRDLQVKVGTSGLGLPILVPCQRPMTVRDLLTHQSGLPAVTSPAGALTMGGGCPTLADLVERLATESLDFQPGAGFSYGVSTDVVGHLVEVLTGESFDVYLEHNVLEPLGMSDTAFWVSPERHNRLSALYWATADGLVLIDDPERSVLRSPTTYFSGAAGLAGTTADYARFALMLGGRGALGETRIIGRKTLELMTVNHLTAGKSIADMTIDPVFAEYHGQGFGLGFAMTLDLAGTQLAGSPGEFYWTGAAGTLTFVDPSEDLVVLFTTQAMPDVTTRGYRNPYRWRELRTLVYAALM
jgi:CubicO group peptidase (beta-lactamase class C family)